MDQMLRSFLPSSDAEPSTGEVLPSIVLHYISLLSGLGNIETEVQISREPVSAQTILGFSKVQAVKPQFLRPSLNFQC